VSGSNHVRKTGDPNWCSFVAFQVICNSYQIKTTSFCIHSNLLLSVILPFISFNWSAGSPVKCATNDCISDMWWNEKGKESSLAYLQVLFPHAQITPRTSRNRSNSSETWRNILKIKGPAGNPNVWLHYANLQNVRIPCRTLFSHVIVTRYGEEAPGSIPAWLRYSLLHIINTDSGVHRVSYPMRTRNRFPLE
jgi:hypothetical protein